jgi:hypothetical protein
VDQSGTFPKRWTDFTTEDRAELHSTEDEMIKEAFMNDYGVKMTSKSIEVAMILLG